MDPGKKSLEDRLDRFERMLDEIIDSITHLRNGLTYGSSNNHISDEISSVITIDKKSAVLCEIDSGDSNYFRPEKIKITVTDEKGERSFCHVGKISVGGAPQNLMDNVIIGDRPTAYGSLKGDAMRSERLSHSDDWRIYRSAKFIPVFGHLGRRLSIGLENPNDFDLRVYISVLGDAMGELDIYNTYAFTDSRMPKSRDPYR